MFTLFDNEQIMEAYGREERREGIRQGRQEGHAEGKEMQAKETAYELQKMGLTTDNIAKAVKVSADVVREWLSEPQTNPAN